MNAMTHKQIVIGLAALLLVCGCGGEGKSNSESSDSKTPEGEQKPAVTAPEPWDAERDRFERGLKIGMTDVEVSKTFGDPPHAHSIMGVDTTVTWGYDLPGGKRFLVRFDGKGKVKSYGIPGAISSVPVQ